MGCNGGEGGWDEMRWLEEEMENDKRSCPPTRFDKMMIRVVSHWES